MEGEEGERKEEKAGIIVYFDMRWIPAKNTNYLQITPRVAPLPLALGCFPPHRLLDLINLVHLNHSFPRFD